MKILFVGVHRPGRSPSQRVRMEQFFPALRARGHDVHYRWLLDARDDQLFYSHGHYAQKVLLVARAASKAISLAHYDRVFVQREMFFLGPALFERRFKRFIYDFDDAIWIRDVSAGNQALAFLKNVDKPAQLMALAGTVLAGNDYLANYARQHSRNVHVMPTVVDTDVLVPVPGATQVGWMGSPSTGDYLKPLLHIFKQVRIVGDPRFGEAWSRETELATLQSFAVGVMPMPDTPWTRGKCGFKALQYMAVGAVPVVSPVGVNSQIVQHEQNGLLAASDVEWSNALARLSEDVDLRHRLATAARRTVVERWSLAAWRDRWVQWVEGT